MVSPSNTVCWERALCQQGRRRSNASGISQAKEPQMVDNLESGPQGPPTGIISYFAYETLRFHDR